MASCRSGDNPLFASVIAIVEDTWTEYVNAGQNKLILREQIPAPDLLQS